MASGRRHMAAPAAGRLPVPCSSGRTSGGCGARACLAVLPWQRLRRCELNASQAMLLLLSAATGNAVCSFALAVGEVYPSFKHEATRWRALIVLIEYPVRKWRRFSACACLLSLAHRGRRATASAREELPERESTRTSGPPTRTSRRC